MFRPEVIEFQNNINETGAINELLNKTEKIEVHTNSYVLRITDKNDMIIRKDNAAFCYIYHNAEWDELDPDRRITWHDRLTVFYNDNNVDSGKFKIKHADASLPTLLAAVKDIVEKKATRSTYVGLEGNHMIPKNYKVINREDNMELCSKTQNCRHYSAWSKVMHLIGKKIAFKLSAFDEAVQFILSNNTELAEFNEEEGYIKLANNQFENNALFIKRNSDEIWEVA